MTFGKALKTLRGERTGLEIAALALGKGASQKKLRDFANYLSKIENDRVPNVGLGRLQLIARGFGFTTLGSFFTEIERSFNPVLESQPEHAQNPSTLNDTTKADRNAVTLSERQDASLSLEVVFEGLVNSIEEAANRVVDRLEQLTNARARKTPRRPRSDSRGEKAS